MNNPIVTTGQTPVTIGSTLTFQLRASKDGQPWDLTGGTLDVLLADITGTVITVAATVTGFGGKASWTVPATSSGKSSVGTWLRAWKATDAAGISMTSRPIQMDVISSPV